MKHKLAKVATYACLALSIGLSTQVFASSQPRTLEGYVEQEDAFFDYLYKNHPIFKYEKDGRLVGKFTHSDRTENWVENQNGPKFAKEHGLENASITYRLPYESFLDFPNKFVGPKNAASVILPNMLLGSALAMQKQCVFHMKWKKLAVLVD